MNNALKFIITIGLAEGRSLYDATRGEWRIGEERRNTEQYKHAVAVANQKVVEVYRIQSWEPVTMEDGQIRWMFSGILADENIRKKCIGKRSVNRPGHADPVVSIDLEELMESEIEKETFRLLHQFYQVILFGPPGTGKTYSAMRVLKKLLRESGAELQKRKGDTWDIVQFHPSYNYEDFVRGIRVKTENEQVVYDTANRVFGEMCERADENRDQKYVLIIDEINRANVSAVLGELIYALEYRNESVKTPYSVKGNPDDLDDLGNSDIQVPKNFFVIGTMNTADRTIGQIDYAVRRRFAFIHCPPQADVIENETARDFFERVDKLFVNENGEQSQYMSSDFDFADVQIGHSYFLAKNNTELYDKIVYQVIPVLREYVKDGVLHSNAGGVISGIEKDIISEIEKEAKDNIEGSGNEPGEGHFFFWEKDGKKSELLKRPRIARDIIAHYIEENPNSVSDIDDLRSKFGMSKKKGWEFIEDITKISDLKLYLTDESNLISLGSCKIAVSHKWSKIDSPRWDRFKKAAQELEYTIVGDNSENKSIKEQGSFPFVWEKDGNWGEFEAMGETARSIIAHYVRENPNSVSSIDDLRSVFRMDGELRNSVVDMRKNPKSHHYSTGEESQIPLSDGSQVAISFQWGSNPKKPKWRKFVEAAKNLGYLVHPCHFVSIGESKTRNWGDCKKYGFVCAGGPKSKEAMEKLKIGDPVFVRWGGEIPVSQKGFIAYGKVTKQARRIDEFRVKDGESEKLLAECQSVKGDGSYKEQHPIAFERAEGPDYAVGVEWQEILDEDKMIKDISWNQSLVRNQIKWEDFMKLCRVFNLK